MIAQEDDALFTGFSVLDVGVDHEHGGTTLRVAIGGSGPPLLLLHGFPQTHAMWAGIATDLARTYTVVAPDLRGYGDSAIPADGENHAGYSFRAMAADALALMAALGFERFAVVGHDRGARVTHRLTLDHPAAVARAAVLDILPTAFVFDHVDRQLATTYYHWFFYQQPDPLPETLIAGNPVAYLHSLLAGWGGPLDAHPPDRLDAYERAFSDPARRHAMLEDYRAAAGIDLEHDAADAAEGRRIDVPLLVVWGARGTVGRSGHDVLGVWREAAADPAAVEGLELDCGHFVVDECPEDTLLALSRFLAPYAEGRAVES